MGTTIDAVILGLCDTIYNLGIYGYDPKLGDEPIDELYSDLEDYWYDDEY